MTQSSSLRMTTSHFRQVRPVGIAVVWLLFPVLAPNGTGTQGQQVGDNDRFPQAHRAAISENPEGVTFTVRFEDGRSQFRQGEVIPMELAFSSTVPDRFVLDAATSDRSGRLNVDSFHVSPSNGVVDPLSDYFRNSPFGGFFGGGPRSMPVLKEEPSVVVLDLNEWLRFDRPGKYRLFVSSKRLTDNSVAAESPGRYTPLTITSNVVEFEVLPRDARWCETKLQEARQMLDSPERGESYRRAARVLRFLDTEGAVKEMVRRLGISNDPEHFQYYLGLIGSAHREIVMRETEKSIQTPDYPVTRELITVRSRLRFFGKYPNPMPPYPGKEEQDAIQLWTEQFRKRQDDYSRMVDGELVRLVRALSTKAAPARLTCLHILLEHIWSRPHERPATFAGRERDWVAELIAHFDELSVALQHELLDWRWEHVRGPETVELVRRLWRSPTDEQRRHGLKGAALGRLHELSPKEAQGIVRQAISTSPPAPELEYMDRNLLGALPEETLPDLDNPLASNLEAAAAQTHGDMETQCYLVARYATPAILPRVKAIYPDSGKWACTLQDDLLAYFLRVSPAFGAEKVRLALSKRGEGYSRCYTLLTSWLANWQMTTELKEIALAALNDPDPEVVADAAKALGEHGPPEVEQALWRRFEQWHNEWKDRKADLQSRYGHANPNYPQIKLEEALCRALAQAPAWLAEKEKLARIQQLCLTDEGQQRFAAYLDAQEIPLSYITRDRWSLAQYELSSFDALEKKLAQYPPGTVLRSRFKDPGEFAPKEKQLKRLQAFVLARGLKLVPK